MLASRCLQQTTATGNTSPLVIGTTAVSGFQLISAEVPANVPFMYIIGSYDGTQTEMGVGYLNASGELVRDAAPEFTYTGGVASNGSRVIFAAGTKYVGIAPYGRGLRPTLPTVYTSANKRYQTTSTPFGTAGTANPTNDTVYFVPFEIHCADSVDAVAWNNTVNGSGNVVAGIYSMDPATGVPMSMLLSGAAVSNAATGFVVSTFSATVLPPGWYYLAMHKQTTGAGTTRTIAGAAAVGGQFAPLGYDSSNNQIIGFTQTTAYTGTLPAVGTLAEVTTGNLPALWLRVA